MVRQSGSESLFAQQYSKAAGHCAMSVAEITGALEDLRKWRQTGQRPAPGARKQGRISQVKYHQY